MSVKTTECKKLNKRTDEWNAIYPFMEWLQEQKIVLCKLDRTVDHWYPIFEKIEDYSTNTSKSTLRNLNRRDEQS